MSQTRAENYNSKTRDYSAETQRGVKPRTSSGRGAEEEGYRKKDKDKSPDRYDWKDSPYADKETVLTDWYLLILFMHRIKIIGLCRILLYDFSLHGALVILFPAGAATLKQRRIIVDATALASIRHCFGVIYILGIGFVVPFK